MCSAGHSARKLLHVCCQHPEAHFFSLALQLVACVHWLTSSMGFTPFAFPGNVHTLMPCSTLCAGHRGAHAGGIVRERGQQGDLAVSPGGFWRHGPLGTRRRSCWHWRCLEPAVSHVLWHSGMLHVAKAPFFALWSGTRAMQPACHLCSWHACCLLVLHAGIN